MGDLDGATIGIIGYGRIGRRVGALATAFGMRLLAYDPFSAPPVEIAAPDVSTLASASDVLTLHVPLTEETHHLVDEAFLDRIRPGTILINCSRGGLVDLDAALAALKSGRLAGVGLDVFDPEPPEHHPMFDHPDVVLTPHLMGMTRRAAAATFLDAARGVVDVLAGRRPAAVANPDWVDAYQEVRIR
jgi:phosphoglycerate dehydrogenase-like enzyme